MRNFEFINQAVNGFSKLQHRIDVLNEVQRQLLLAGLILTLSLVSLGTCFFPAYHHQIALTTQKKQLITTNQALEAVIKQLKSEEEIEKKRKAYSPRKISETDDIIVLLKHFIKQDPRLQLLQLSTTPPAKLKENGKDFLVDNKAVYQTQVTLTLSGEFYALISYIDQLEHMPWYFFWKNMQYQVTQYPKATLVLTLQVLSLSPETTT